MKESHEYYMRLALRYAAEAQKFGEVPVGALVTDAAGNILGTGYNTREQDGLSTSHAEMRALESACRERKSWRLSDCTLYVTLEPCPMCAGAAWAARIGHIVYGAKDALCGAVGGHFSLQKSLDAWNPEITGGVLADECASLLQTFFAGVRQKPAAKRLTREFYARPAETVAKELLGKTLCVRNPESGEVRRAVITETEAYLGENDSACHGSRGKTDRNRPMYSRGGTVYVYLCYGLHSMLNLVTGEKGVPEAVLLRGAEGVDGPGKLTRYFGIDRKLNEADAVLSDVLWVESDGSLVPPYESLPRVGIAYAEEKDREALLRFRVIGGKSPSDISEKRQNRPKPEQ